MTELQSRESNGRPTTVSTRPDDPTEPRAEETHEGASAPLDAVPEAVRTGVTATAAVLQEWADSLAGLPFAVLGRSDVGPIMSGRIWVDGTFELIDVWWTVHRRSVEQLLAVQRKSTAQMLDSGWALAESSRTLGRRSRPAEPPTTRSAPR